MSELKLYRVYFTGEKVCNAYRVANSPEEAMMRCLNHSKKPEGSEENSCRVEEVKVDGYKINIEKL